MTPAHWVSVVSTGPTQNFKIGLPSPSGTGATAGINDDDLSKFLAREFYLYLYQPGNIIFDAASP